MKITASFLVKSIASIPKLQLLWAKEAIVQIVTVMKLGMKVLHPIFVSNIKRFLNTLHSTISHLQYYDFKNAGGIRSFKETITFLL